MLELGHVRPPRGAPARAIAWPIALLRVEVVGQQASRRPDPFTALLLDAAIAGPVDLDRLARLSGLPRELLEERKAAAEGRGLLDQRGRLTRDGDGERLQAPEEARRSGWMAQCRVTGHVLPAFFDAYPRRSWSDDKPLQISPREGLKVEGLALQLALRSAWHTHDRREQQAEDREAEGGTDLWIEPVEPDETDGEPAEDRAVGRAQDARQASGRLHVHRKDSVPQWREARLDLWVEVDPLLPEEHAVTVFAGCPEIGRAHV